MRPLHRSRAWGWLEAGSLAKLAQNPNLFRPKAHWEMKRLLSNVRADQPDSSGDRQGISVL